MQSHSKNVENTPCCLGLPLMGVKHFIINVLEGFEAQFRYARGSVYIHVFILKKSRVTWNPRLPVCIFEFELEMLKWLDTLFLGGGAHNLPWMLLRVCAWDYITLDESVCLNVHALISIYVCILNSAA